MSEESTQNILVRNDDQVAESKVATTFDATARNKFSFDYHHSDGKIYEIFPVFDPVSDDRYMQWLREFNLKGSEESVDDKSLEVSVKLWDEIVPEVGNVDFPDGSDWRAMFNFQAKLDMLSHNFAVAVVEGFERADGKLVLGGDEVTTIWTECWFNNEVVKQRHDLPTKTFEMKKKYNRILNKRFEQEKVGGLRRKPKVIYRPQDHKMGEFYDDILIKSEGFASGVTPLRFKTAVMDAYFDSQVSEKKLVTE